jgi:hypothetical protein
LPGSLTDEPPEIEWFAKLANDATRRAHKNALKDFMGIVDIIRPDEFRSANDSHVIACRDELINRARSGMTIRHRLGEPERVFFAFNIA